MKEPHNMNNLAKLKLREIGRDIRARRKVLGWSQEKLSEAADVSLESVKRLEGEANTRTESVVKIMLALDMATAPSATLTPDSQQIKSEIHRLVDML